MIDKSFPAFSTVAVLALAGCGSTDIPNELTPAGGSGTDTLQTGGDTGASAGGAGGDHVAAGDGGQQSLTGGAQGQPESSGGSGGQSDDYFIDVTVDDVNYHISAGVRVQSHIAGLYLSGEMDQFSFSIFFFDPPIAAGKYNCDGGVSFTVSLKVDGIAATDYIDPIGGCSLELTEVGSEYSGKIEASVVRLSGEGEPYILTKGTFRVPFVDGP